MNKFFVKFIETNKNTIDCKMNPGNVTSTTNGRSSTLNSTTHGSGNGNNEDAMDWNQTNSNRIQDFTGDNSSSVQFVLSTLTLSQLQELKKLLKKEKEALLFDSRVCTVCMRSFNSAHACKLHQQKTHFSILLQYRKAYGELFESALQNVRF
jgi:hypothetical protein